VLCRSFTGFHIYYSSLTETSWQIRLLVKARAFLTIPNLVVDAATVTGSGQDSHQHASSQATESKATSIPAAAETMASTDQNCMDEQMKSTSPLEPLGMLSSESGKPLTIDTQHDNTSARKEPRSSRDKYLARLEYCIRNALIGMVDSLTKQSSQSSLRNADGYYASGRHRLVRHGELKLRNAFLTMAVWYVMNHCERALNATFRQTLKSTIDTLEKLYQHDTPTRKRRQVSDGSELRDSILHWYHFGCLRQILEWLTAKATHENRAPEILRIESIEAGWRKRAEMIVSSYEKGQLDTAQRNSPQEEELDRLILMSQELGLEPSVNKTSPLVKQVRAKIFNRKQTTQFNHGPHAESDSRFTPGPAPWELFCLNHHTPLSLQLFSSTGTDDRDPTAIDREKRNLFLFLQSDSSFMSTWDRSEKDMIAQWWDVEATTVVCATLLDIRNGSQFSIALSRYNARLLTLKLGINRPLAQPFGSRDVKPDLKDEDRTIGQQFQQRTKRQQLLEDEMMPVRWIDFKPSLIYHPEFTRISLDDTPTEFSAEKLGKIPLYNNITIYCAKKWSKSSAGKNGKVDETQAVKEVLLQDWSLKTLKEKIASKELMFLNVFDLALSPARDQSFWPVRGTKASWKITIINTINRSYDCCKTLVLKMEDFPALQQLDKLEWDEQDRVWSGCLDGNIALYISSTKDQRSQDEVRNELEKFKEEYKDQLLSRLSDSVRHLRPYGTLLD